MEKKEGARDQEEADTDLLLRLGLGPPGGGTLPPPPPQTPINDTSPPASLSDHHPSQIIITSHLAPTPIPAPSSHVPNKTVVAAPLAPPPKNGAKRGYLEAMGSIVADGGNVVHAHGNYTPARPTTIYTMPTSAKSSGTVHASPLGGSKSASPPRKLAGGPKFPETAVAARPSSETPPKKVVEATAVVVGWPPVRSFRKQTLATTLVSKPPGDDESHYVKVNMDGMPIGRKLDLNTYKGYQELQYAVEDMFQPTANGHESMGHFRFLSRSEYVLTYEDKDGDWMLVGDVPWEMFANTVKRLRIMKDGDSSHLDAERSAKVRCHG